MRRNTKKYQRNQSKTLPILGLWFFVLGVFLGMLLLFGQFDYRGHEETDKTLEALETYTMVCESDRYGSGVLHDKDLNWLIRLSTYNYGCVITDQSGEIVYE